MAGTPPPIDSRTPEELVTKAEALVAEYSGWVAPPERQDPGSALIRVFARMLGHVIERLNRVPEKHRLAFLELLGASRQAPEAARVPLTFQLVPGASGAIVPQGTSVSGNEGLPFETEQELALTPARLTELLVHEPRTPAHAERLWGSGVAAPATNLQVVEHSLFLACDALFTQPEVTGRWLELTWEQPPDSPLTWAFWNGQAWQALPEAEPERGAVWQLELKDIAPVPRELQGRTARWLRAQPQVPSSKPRLQGVQPRMTVDRKKGVAPDLAYFDTLALDLSKDVLPFGEQPRFNYAFYVSSQEVLWPGGNASKPRKITLAVAWSDASPWQGVPLDDVTVTLSWEYWNGTGWDELGTSTKRGGVPPFVDGTRALTQGGDVVFQLPPSFQETSVQGRPGRWLRMRIRGGDYGGSGVQRPRPPVLKALTFHYKDTVNPPLDACLSLNAGTWEDLTAALAGTQAVAPFQVMGEAEPALYLGFDRPFGDTPISLYAQVALPRPEEVAVDARGAALALAERPRLRWEYLAGEGWRPLIVEDETGGFRRSGLLRFIGPDGLVPGLQFGRRAAWLRARWLSAGVPDFLRLQGLVPNTVWASQSMTVAEEVLGSSTGTPAQTFFTAKAPVLEDFQLEVREREWVRWEAVPDFLASGPRDRHYTLDVERGEVRFGDDVRGRIPPAGGHNVRLSYRFGGGAAGNVPVDTLTRLDSSIPYVNSVSQLEPATGGTELEPLSLLAERQARLLRHGGRAVTVADYEDLARAASPRIARVRAIPPAFDPIQQADAPNPAGVQAGRVLVVLVPWDSVPKPTPDLELLRDVEEYLRARCPPTTVLQVGGPTWVEAHVQARLAPRPGAGGELVRARARETLARYLHPLTGGPEATGWDFGQWPSASALVALLSRLDGVDHVVSASIQARPANQVRGPTSLLFVEARHITVELDGTED